MRVELMLEVRTVRYDYFLPPPCLIERTLARSQRTGWGRWSMVQLRRRLLIPLANHPSVCPVTGRPRAILGAVCVHPTCYLPLLLPEVL